MDPTLHFICPRAGHGTCKPVSAFVDATIALDELVQWFREPFLCQRIAEGARDHLDRVRLSTLAGSVVQRIIAANGSSPANGQILRHRSAQ